MFSLRVLAAFACVESNNFGKVPDELEETLSNVYSLVVERKETILDGIKWNPDFFMTRLGKVRLVKSEIMCSFEKNREWYALPDGRRHGTFTSFYVCGKKCTEMIYSNGKPHGKETFWYENGQVGFEQWWENGELHGPSEGWFLNGARHWKMMHSFGKRIGKCRFYHSAGNNNLSDEYNSKNGKLHGVFLEYDIHGRKIRERHYVDGKENGKRTSWILGEKTEEREFVDGKEHGKCVNYCRLTGEKTRKRKFVDGKMHGFEILYRRITKANKDGSYKTITKKIHK